MTAVNDRRECPAWMTSVNDRPRMLWLTGALLAALLIGASIGPYPLPPQRILAALFGDGRDPQASGQGGLDRAANCASSGASRGYFSTA